jgi:uncharacterized protein
MGHSHSPEELSGQSAVPCADRGSAPLVEERLTQSSKAAIQMALLALRFYKSYLSLLFAGSCRFEPTCSSYACQAIERFGVLPGSWLALKRLLRCHPLSRRFGFDPVPEKWKEMPSQSTVAPALRSEVQS